MSMLGKIRIGHKAPDFHCEAVTKGIIEDVTLSDYIHPSIKAESPNPDAPWLIIMFIPAAFSFVYPTEVLAFQNCLDEFKDRNCSVVFISVDTKHSLWHWQNVPRQYGGLGQIDIPLLSDATHRTSRDYGVLIEEEGVSLRGMFIIDGEGIVQQITLNNVTVGRSVLEALRLLEAFQAVAKHGVLCPIDWKPSNDAADTLNTISNTLTESYEERLANLQKEFGGVQVTDLDAKLPKDDSSKEGSTNGEQKSNGDAPNGSLSSPIVRPTRSHSSPPAPNIPQQTCERPKQTSPMHSHRNDCLPHHQTSPPTPTRSDSFKSARSTSAPPTGHGTPTPTPTLSYPPSTKRPGTGTARHSRGMHPQRHRSTSSPVAIDARYMSSLFSHPAPSIFQTLIRRISNTSTDSSSGHSTAPPTPNPKPKPAASQLSKTSLSNTYESRTGSHVVLEFADPMPNPQDKDSPHGTPARRGTMSRSASYHGNPTSNGWGRGSPLSPDTASSVVGGLTTPSQTRLQATFEALKKMGSGLASPRAEVRAPGYFDVVVEGAEA